MSWSFPVCSQLHFNHSVWQTVEWLKHRSSLHPICTSTRAKGKPPCTVLPDASVKKSIFLTHFCFGTYNQFTLCHSDKELWWDASLLFIHTTVLREQTKADWKVIFGLLVIFTLFMFAFCVCLSVLQWPWRLILAGSCWRTHTCSTQEQVSWCWDQCLWSAASCLWASLALSWVNHPLMLLYHIHMPYIHGLKFTHKVPNASKNQSWRVYETVLLFSWPVTLF